MFKRINIFLIVLLLLPLFEVSAEEEQAAVVDTSELIVGTVVDIDKSNRILTLRVKNDEESTFTLGPEVQNFDEIKHGNQVMAQYFNAFAIALGPKNVGLKGDNRQLEIETAKQGKKNRATTRTVAAVGIVEAVDQKNSLITVKGEEQTIVVNVSEHYDLSRIIVGNDVELTYIESYAINIKPASKILGTVTFNSTSVALGFGFEWGQGKLTMYDGSTYTFDIEGISVLDVGISLVKAEGKAYRVIEPKDMEGDYWAAGIGISYGNGVSAVRMKNSHGVILSLTSKQKGMKLTLAAEGVRIKNIMPVK